MGARTRHTVPARHIVPDETVEIIRALVAWCDGDLADVVFTTGGTGPRRDVTPEATRVVLERQPPGLAERLRGVELDRFLPRGAVTRGRGDARADARDQPAGLDGWRARWPSLRSADPGARRGHRTGRRDRPFAGRTGRGTP
ncbi:MAG: hypothetical protein IPF87_02825 [Gemmatimonadetes bacterium]|nr:hypothetical protein [Gemmatimonadota bacterium]